MVHAVIDKAFKKDAQGQKLENIDVSPPLEDMKPQHLMQSLEREWQAELGHGGDVSLSRAFRKTYIFQIFNTAWMFMEAAVAKGRIEAFLKMTEVAPRPKPPADPELAVIPEATTNLT